MIRLKSNRFRESSIVTPGSSVRTGAVALTDQMVASATNFFTGVIVGRTCSKEQFGLYMLGLSLVLVAARLQTSLISVPHMVHVPNLHGRERCAYTGSTLVHQFGLSAIAVLTLLLGGVLLSNGIGPRDLSPVIWALVFTITFILIRDYARNVCFALLRYRSALLIDISLAVVQLGALALVARFGLLTPGFAFWIIGASCGVVGVGWLLGSRVYIVRSFGDIVSDSKLNWSLGKWIFFSSLLWELSINLYPWILTYFHGAASTGVWTACWGVVAIANPVLLGMQNLMVPRMAKSYVRDGVLALRKMSFDYGTVFSLLVMPLGLLLIIFGGWVVAAVYGEKYAGNGIVVSVLAVNFMITPIRLAISRALITMRRADVDWLTNTVPLAVLFLLGIMLARLWGPVGVSLGMLTGNLGALLAKHVSFVLVSRSDARLPKR